MSSYDLLVIDDFGLMELDLEKCRDLFEIIETRDSRKATMIVSQLPVANWWDLFKDSTYIIIYSSYVFLNLIPAGNSANSFSLRKILFFLAHRSD